MPNQSRPFVGTCDHYVSVVVSKAADDPERWHALWYLRELLESGQPLSRQARMQLYAARTEDDLDMILEIIRLSRVPQEERIARYAKARIASLASEPWDAPVQDWTGRHTKADGESRPIKSLRQTRVQHRRWSRKLHDRNRWLERQAKQLGQDS
jgi:hypothetical protein